MQATTEQKLIHEALHNNHKVVVVRGEHLKVEIGQAGRYYVEWQDITFEKAIPSSPGKAGELASKGIRVTICKQTGRPWILVTDKEQQDL